MKKLEEIRGVLEGSDKVNFLRLVLKKHPRKKEDNFVNGNLLDLTYHCVLAKPIERELNYGRDLFVMEKVLGNLLSVGTKDVHPINVEYDLHYELEELRGVYYSLEIPVGQGVRSVRLNDDARNYLKSIGHSDWKGNAFVDDLFFNVSVNLYANDRFATKCMKNDNRQTNWPK